MPQPTLADDCERMVRILADAPVGGLSLDEIQEITHKTGEPWSLRTINMTLVALGSRATHAKVRERRGKVTKYNLRREHNGI